MGREPLVLDRIEESFSASVNVISCDSDRVSECVEGKEEKGRRNGLKMTPFAVVTTAPPVVHCYQPTLHPPPHSPPSLPRPPAGSAGWPAAEVLPPRPPLPADLSSVDGSSLGRRNTPRISYTPHYFQTYKIREHNVIKLHRKPRFFGKVSASS